MTTLADIQKLLADQDAVLEPMVKRLHATPDASFVVEASDIADIDEACEPRSHTPWPHLAERA